MLLPSLWGRKRGELCRFTPQHSRGESTPLSQVSRASIDDTVLLQSCAHLLHSAQVLCCRVCRLPSRRGGDAERGRWAGRSAEWTEARLEPRDRGAHRSVPLRMRCALAIASCPIGWSRCGLAVCSLCARVGHGETPSGRPHALRSRGWMRGGTDGDTESLTERSQLVASSPL